MSHQETANLIFSRIIFSRLNGIESLTTKQWDETKYRRQSKGSDRGGEFAPKGGGDKGSRAFIAPAIDDPSGSIERDTDKAIDQLDGERHANQKRIMEDVDRQLGIKSTHVNAVGVWADGAENSLTIKVQGVDHEKLKYATAIKAKLARQKDAIAFTPDEKGNSYLYTVSVRDKDIRKLRKAATDSGLAYHTIHEDGKRGSKVIVFDPSGSGELDDAVQKFAGEVDTYDAERDRGHGEFLTEEYNSRAKAAAKYDKIIADYEKANPDQRHYKGEARSGSGDRRGGQISKGLTPEQLAFSMALFSRAASTCGANAKGGHGFQPGNNCAANKNSGGGDDSKTVAANEIDIPEVSAEEREIEEANAIPGPSSRGEINSYLEKVKSTAVHKKVQQLLTNAQEQTISGDVRYASIEMNIKCCPDANDILSGKVEFLPERERLHEEIVEDMLPRDTIAEPGERPVAVLLIGPPGAGKSSAGNPIIQSLGVKFATVNNDEVKAALPEYKGWNAAMVHEESAQIVENMVMPKAINDRHNMILDGVGASANKMVKIAESMSSKGYDVHLVHVTIPTEKTVDRAWKRFAKSAFSNDSEPGRYVPIDYIADAVDQKPTKTYEVVRDSGHVVSWSSYSNDVKRGEKPVLIDKGEAE